VQSARETVQWLAGWLPTHLTHEEQGILAGIRALGPDLAAFAREMKHQHKEIHTRLDSLRHVVDNFNDASDLQQSICDLKEEGKALATFMATHMGAEERKYATLK
jgi:iron-sulfur cluster repair protein YtfE (RIC family)